VTKPPRDGEWVDAGPDEVSDVRVPQAMEPHPWKAALADEPVEGIGDRLWMADPSVGGGK
jgi:hypothetical protein